jgi:predicted GH43/DUF377 family glycosyl hydrolase
MKSKTKLSFLLKIQLILTFCSICLPLFYFLSFKNKIEFSNRDRNAYRRFFEKYKPGGEALMSLNKIRLPERLKNIPFADAQNIVLKTKKVAIRNVVAPYNASIIKHGSGYLMFFRYDLSSKHTYFSYIGCAELDSNFDQTDKEFITLNTHHDHSEDPRVFSTGKEIFLMYSTSEFKKYFLPFPFISTVTLSRFDLKKYKLETATSLELNLSLTEKNWVPFEYIDKQNVPHFYLQYGLNPHKILRIPNPNVNEVIHEIFPKEDVFYITHWDNKGNGWGELRGGTPALKVGDEYLAFFHSCFRDKNDLIWYAMGAYTFEGEPPFKITAISSYPILFQGMYESGSLNTSDPQRRVIFPVGFVIEQNEDKELIHLSCGENDSAIKIVTLDKAKLINLLRKI